MLISLGMSALRCAVRRLIGHYEIIVRLYQIRGAGIDLSTLEQLLERVEPVKARRADLTAPIICNRVIYNLREELIISFNCFDCNIEPVFLPRCRPRLWIR